MSRGWQCEATPFMLDRGMKTFTLGCATAALLLTSNILVARPAGAPNRHRVVAGWTVDRHAEEDGGYLVTLRRDAGPIHLRYTAAFWRGNDGRIQSMMVERGDCGNGEEIGRHILLPARALRGMFASILAECAVPPARIRDLLAGLEPAYALTLAWSRGAEQATAAEAAAIANYGR
jgi:hypothetical protein